MSTTSRPSSDEGASLLAILDELRELVSGARSMPMSASVIVNRAEALALVDSARSVVPSEIIDADAVLGEADSVLARARAQADQVLADAEARATHLASKENVVALAEERAAQIVGEAEVQAATLRADANDYCDRQLAQFEIDLDAVTTQVRAGRERLAARAQEDRDQADRLQADLTRSVTARDHRDPAQRPGAAGSDAENRHWH